MSRIIIICAVIAVPLLAGCTSIDRTSTSSISTSNMTRPYNRGCYPQESLTQPRFGSCPGYHEAQ
jgi:hypothetical protein